MSLKLYTQKEVCEMIQKSRTTLWRWISSGNFSTPLQIGPNSQVWTDAQLHDWLASKA